MQTKKRKKKKKQKDDGRGKIRKEREKQTLHETGQEKKEKMTTKEMTQENPVQTLASSSACFKFSSKASSFSACLAWKRSQRTRRLMYNTDMEKRIRDTSTDADANLHSALIYNLAVEKC